MHPDVLATLQDFLSTLPENWKQEYTPQQLWQRLLFRYHVSTWGIEKEFAEFFQQVMQKHRCSKCGDNNPLYFIKGDDKCIRCEV